MTRLVIPSRLPAFWDDWKEEIVVPCAQHVVHRNAKVKDEHRAHFEDVLTRIFAQEPKLTIKEATSAEKKKRRKTVRVVDHSKPSKMMIRKGVSVRSLKLKQSTRQPCQAANPSADASANEGARIKLLEEENRRLMEENRRFAERAENAETALAEFRQQHKEHMKQCDMKPASANTGTVSSLADEFTRSLVISTLNDTELLQQKLHEVSGETKHEVRDTTDRFCLELLEDLPNELKQELMTYTVGTPYSACSHPEEEVGADEAGPFQLVGHLGRGGFGVVNRVRLTRDLAIKDIAIRDPEHVQEIIREGQRCYKLSHPVKTSELLYRYVDAQRQQIYLVHPLMKKGDVDNILRRLKRPLTEPEAAQLIKDLLEGLNFLHEKDIAHRDVKPLSILVNDECEGKLADMGLAADASRMRQTGLGTPGYMSPEMIVAGRTGKPYDGHAADAYAVGVTVCKMVTRREPFVSVDDNGIFRETMNCKVCATAEKFAKDAGITVSKECRAFIRSCLPFNPTDRASIRDLLRSDFIRVASIDALKTGLAGV